MPRYMTYGTLTLKPGSRPMAERIADQGAPSMAQQPGFQQVMFFLDEDRNEYGAVTVWNSREDAERANEVLTPQFEQAFGDLLMSPIRTQVFEIYEHKQ